MKIGIDTQSLKGHLSGLGIYTSQIITALKRIDDSNEYVLLGEQRQIGQKTYDRLIWENFGLRKESAKNKIDLLFTPAFAAPFLKGPWRSVAVIHDLIGKIFPENLSAASRFYWSQWLPHVNSKCDSIIADSQVTKDDILKFTKIDEKKVDVVYLAAPDRFNLPRNKAQIDAVMHKFGIKPPYFFFVGNIEPRKNLIRTIKAFMHAQQSGKIDHMLILVGSRSWNYPQMDALLKESSFRDKVKILNYVDDEELLSLYNGADLFVFPSLYEGFGIPILEAMKCGVPVLTSRLSSIPEIAGDAAFYVDPYREEAIAEGMIELATNSKLRTELTDKGRRQASKFDWDSTARKTRDIFNKLGSL